MGISEWPPGMWRSSPLSAAKPGRKDHMVLILSQLQIGFKYHIYIYYEAHTRRGCMTTMNARDSGGYEDTEEWKGLLGLK